MSFASDFCYLLLATFHIAGRIIVKHLIPGRSDEVWVGVEPLTL